MSRQGRDWPLLIRRARPEDREGVLSFASQTPEGPDYIPDVFDEWVNGAGGVLLVGLRAEPDAPDRPVCIARVVPVSAHEVWLEGLRVDPAVRGLGVATDLQTAELHWAAAHGARVVRYVTGEKNEGSHKVGAKHGLRVVSIWRTYFGPAGGEGSGGDAILERLAGTGRTVQEGVSADGWWEKLTNEPGFRSLDALHESRSWAFQELTGDRFMSHVAREEVLAMGESGGSGRGDGRRGDRSEWAVTVIDREDTIRDGALRLSLLWGSAAGMERLVGALGGLTQVSRLRLPEPEPPVMHGAGERFRALGYERRENSLHLLARDLDPDALPHVDPARLTLLEPPSPTVH